MVKPKAHGNVLSYEKRALPESPMGKEEEYEISIGKVQGQERNQALRTQPWLSQAFLIMSELATCSVTRNQIKVLACLGGTEGQGITFYP